jgi:hypothetical protein
LPKLSRTSRFSGKRLIAHANIHFAHNSWAVKFHAYSLDSSLNLASALQQKLLFPQPSFGIRGHSMIRAVRQPGFIHRSHPVSESHGEI